MDPLSVLEIAPGTSLEEAKKTYRKLCLKYHPDKNPDTNTSEKFHKITTAFKSILENPSLLNPVYVSSPLNSFIQINLLVPLKKIYLYEDVIFIYNRLKLCSRCEGSGLYHGKSDSCEHCGGAGRIKSSALKILGGDGICPVCNGSGSKSNKICLECHGYKRVSETLTCKIKVDVSDAQKGIIILHGKGNEHTSGVYGDVKIIIKVTPDSVFTLKENFFVTYVTISPVDKILRSPRTIDIYGKIFNYNVIQEEGYYILEDNRPGIPTRKISIRYTELYPFVTPQTRSLYEKILEIEKNLYEVRIDGFEPLF